jgi:hypothetical protein
MSCSAILVEVQAVSGDDVKQVVEAEAAQQRGFEVIRRDQVLLPAGWGDEVRGRGAVAAVGKELQREEGSVVPPLRRFRSMAYGVQVPWRSCVLRAGGPRRPSAAVAVNRARAARTSWSESGGPAVVDDVPRAGGGW